MFLHIPKTGGVTLRAALRHKYPGRVITLHSPREPARVGELPVEERRAARVLTGHLPYGVDRYMPQECDYITMLREPVARVVSTYHHVLDHPQHWFHDEAVGNDMGLEDFVGAVEGPSGQSPDAASLGPGRGRARDAHGRLGRGDGARGQRRSTRRGRTWIGSSSWG